MQTYELKLLNAVSLHFHFLHSEVSEVLNISAIFLNKDFCSPYSQSKQAIIKEKKKCVPRQPATFMQ